MVEDMPPEWAIERALSLMANGFQPSVGQCQCRPEYWTAQINVARYIAQHEEPPVDPVSKALADAIRHFFPNDLGIYLRKDGTGLAVAERFVADLRRRGIEISEGGKLAIGEEGK